MANFLVSLGYLVTSRLSSSISDALKNNLGINGVGLSQARCPSCHQNNSIKALKCSKHSLQAMKNHPLALFCPDHTTDFWLQTSNYLAASLPTSVSKHIIKKMNHIPAVSIMCCVRYAVVSCSLSSDSNGQAWSIKLLKLRSTVMYTNSNLIHYFTLDYYYEQQE